MMRKNWCSTGYLLGSITYTAQQLVELVIRPMSTAFRSSFARLDADVIVFTHMCDMMRSTWTAYVREEPFRSRFGVIIHTNPVILAEMSLSLLAFLRAWTNRIRYDADPQFDAVAAYASALAPDAVRQLGPVVLLPPGSSRPFPTSAASVSALAVSSSAAAASSSAVPPHSLLSSLPADDDDVVLVSVSALGALSAPRNTACLGIVAAFSESERVFRGLTGVVCRDLVAALNLLIPSDLGRLCAPFESGRAFNRWAAKHWDIPVGSSSAPTAYDVYSRRIKTRS